MDSLIVRRALQVITGILLGIAVVAVAFLGFPWPGNHAGPAAGPTWSGEGTGALQDGPPGAFFLDDPYPAPSFSLATPAGRTMTEDDLEGRVSVVFFGFASCPDVCPITLGNLSRALELLEEAETASAAAVSTVQVLFVSVDPRRDTPEVLDRYMERFHPAVTALTAPEPEVREVARDWGIHVAYVPLTEETPDPHAGHVHDAPTDGGEALGPADLAELPFPDDAGDYTVDHTARSLLVDHQGRVAGTLAPYLTPREIVEALLPLLDP